jgi:phenylacetate-CoA ligase
MPYYYEKLVQLRLKEIIGYPSSLFAVAKYIVKNNLKSLRPRIVITTAETLLERQREVIELAFGCPVADQYGCTEMSLFVSQCEFGSYHIHPEHGFVEVIDSNGEPAQVGDSGEVVCTGFVNKAMPLIRYRLMDSASMSADSCECGRPFPVLKRIGGRLDDILMAPDGRPLGRLDPVFKGLKGIYETQIVQTDKYSMEIRMVTDPWFGENEMKEFIYELRKRIGYDMRVNVKKVYDIPKDSNGKFRTVVSMLKK